MNEFKGTPGPWEVEDNGYFYDINAVRGTVGNVCSSASWFDNGEHRGTVAMANAQLIAAAPELLEALQNMVEAYQHEASIDNPALLSARAAIAKALGESKYQCANWRDCKSYRYANEDLVMKKNGVFTQNDGSKVASLGDGYVGIKFGYCHGEKLIAIANSVNRGVPGDEVDDIDEAEIYITFKDNASIQRLIDGLVNLRDHK